MMLNSINFFGGETVYPNSPIIIIFSTYLMPPKPGGGCDIHRIAFLPFLSGRGRFRQGNLGHTRPSNRGYGKVHHGEGHANTELPLPGTKV